MNKLENWPSISNRKDLPGGESSSATVGDTSFIVKVMNDINLARIENDEINHINMESLIEKTGIILVEK